MSEFWKSPAPPRVPNGGPRQPYLRRSITAIPFLQHDAVDVGGWMTNAQFVDGIALSGILPAPLIIFTTFVGYLGGGSGAAWP